MIQQTLGDKGFRLGCIKLEMSGKHCRGGTWIYVSGVQQSDLDWGYKLESCWHAAAAAKSSQLCPTLCNPIDSSPPGFPVPGILQARTLEWVAISFSNA